MSASAHTPSERFTHENTGLFKKHLMFQSKKTFVENGNMTNVSNLSSCR